MVMSKMTEMALGVVMVFNELCAHMHMHMQDHQAPPNYCSEAGSGVGSDSVN